MPDNFQKMYDAYKYNMCKKRRNGEIMQKRIISLMLVLILATAMMPFQSRAAGLKLNRTEASLYAGQTLRLKVAGGNKAKWSSSKPSVAAVSKTGKVTAKKKGKATITAKAGKKKLKCKITVKNASTLYIKVRGQTLSASLVNNSSARAMTKWIAKKGSVSVKMSDYANMEKVGSLGKDFPTNDKNIKTKAGDLILYQGNQFVIYYDTNEWEFTRLGKIQGVSAGELKKILGDGDVTITLSLKK